MKNFLKSFGRYFLTVAIALLSFGSGAVTDIGQALQIAIDKDKALAQAAVIINDTPKAEIIDAVEEKTESRGEVVETQLNIKPDEKPQ